MLWLDPWQFTVQMCKGLCGASVVGQMEGQCRGYVLPLCSWRNVNGTNSHG